MSVSAGKMLVRDWRGGELGILVAALVVAVAIVSGISAFATRLQGALVQESHRFLAADRVVSSGRPLPVDWLVQAGVYGLDSARTLTFPSMIYAGEDQTYLASVKAVSKAYPLRGELTYSMQPFGALMPAPQGPQRGKVWLDSRLFPLLGVSIGDSVEIGEASFTVAAAARTEPDQGMSFVDYGPRALIHVDDIPATNIVQPGSRVSYRFLFAGKRAELDQFERWVEPQLEGDQRWIDLDSGQPGVGSALQRAERFLLLAGSLAVVLAGVAIALAAKRFSERHYDYVAIMKSLGATSAKIDRLYATSLLAIGVVATVVGCSLGWLLQLAFFQVFAEAMPVAPGDSGPRPYFIGGATALVCLLSFAWPPLRRLGRASPLRVLRRDMPAETARTLGDYLIGLVAVALLMLWYSRDPKLTLAIMAGLGVTVALGMVLALSLLRGGRLVGMSAGSIWRLALAGLQRRGTANAIQVVIFSMAIMLLLVLILVRTTLINEWQAQIPENTPNHFMLNISPGEVVGIEQLLTGRGIKSQPMFPMIRGRMMAIDGKPLVRTDDMEQSRRQRETNLTWSFGIPEGNELVAGEWWAEDTDEKLVSVEREFADRMQLEVGSRVSFLVGAMPLDATVASIRDLEWQSLQPNFYLVFPPKVLEAYPATFMTSFVLDATDKRFLNDFIRQFPTVTVIEVDAVIEQIRSIVDQVSSAIEWVLGAILLAGALVLVAGVQSSVDARMQESAILRALGASRRLILGGLLIEFSAMGLFAGVLATLGAEVSVAILQVAAMDMNYLPHPGLWPLGAIVGVLLIGGLGVYSCRKVVSSPPLAVLREL